MSLKIGRNCKMLVMNILAFLVYYFKGCRLSRDCRISGWQNKSVMLYVLSKTSSFFNTEITHLSQTFSGQFKVPFIFGNNQN